MGRWMARAIGRGWQEVVLRYTVPSTYSLQSYHTVLHNRWAHGVRA